MALVKWVEVTESERVRHQSQSGQVIIASFDQSRKRLNMLFSVHIMTHDLFFG